MAVPFEIDLLTQSFDFLLQLGRFPFGLVSALIRSEQILTRGRVVQTQIVVREFKMQPQFLAWNSSVNESDRLVFTFAQSVPAQPIRLEIIAEWVKQEILLHLEHIAVEHEFRFGVLLASRFGGDL